MYATQRSASSTRAAGAMVTVSVVAIVSFALTTGIGGSVISQAPEPTMLAFIDAPKETVLDPLPPIEIEEVKPTLSEPPPFVAPPVFEVAETPIIAAPVETGAPTENVRPVAGSDRVAPRIRPSAEPPYPVQSARMREQGVTSLDICVNDRGRVTAAQVTRSSGHARLDEAALKWIREARFTPASIGGAPQAVCGHPVDYQWRLRD